MVREDSDTGPLLREILSPEAETTLARRRPFLLKYRSSTWFILATICLALFTDSFVYGVLVPVLPFLLHDGSHIPDGSEQIWTSALFALFGVAILVGSPICGYFADKVSSRRVLLLSSLPVLAISTLLLGVDENVHILLISRTLAGLSTALVWTVGLALTKDSVPADEVGRSMGVTLTGSGLGLVISPLLGGLLYSAAGLWGVLGMIFGLIGLDLILMTLMIEKKSALAYYLPENQQLPPNVQYGTIRTLSDPHHSHHAVTPVKYYNEDETETEGLTSINSSLSNSETITIEEAQEPLLNHPHTLLLLIRSPRILACAFGVFTQFGILASFDAFLPLFVKRRFNYGSLGAGLLFLNIALPALLGPIAGRLSDKYGPRRIAFTGCIMAAPMLMLLSLVGSDPSKDVILLCVLLSLTGIFITMITSPLAADLGFAVDKMDADRPGIFGDKGAYAQAYALFNCAMAAATVVGPVVAGAVQDRVGTQGVAIVLGSWCILAAIPVLFFIGDKPLSKPHVETGLL